MGAEMKYNSRKSGAGRQKSREDRKKSKIKGQLLIFLMGILLVVLTLRVKALKLEVQEVKKGMQILSDQVEALQFETVAYAAPQETEDAVWKQTYAESIPVMNVEKPQQRTEQEVLYRLQEMGKDNPVIEEISQNASLYPDNMLEALANNPEMADYVAGYLSEKGSREKGLTEAEKAKDFPLLMQWDPRWGYEPYGGSYIGLAGCGPTCMSMVLYALTGNEQLTPDYLAAYAMENNYFVQGQGTAWLFMEETPLLYGIRVIKPEATEYSMKAELDKGNVMICALKQGDFTAVGHFIMVYGYDDMGFLVNDPNCAARSRRSWSFAEIGKQIRGIWAYGYGS